jgi:hypothetical protein
VAVPGGPPLQAFFDVVFNIADEDLSHVAPAFGYHDSDRTFVNPEKIALPWNRCGVLGAAGKIAKTFTKAVRHDD